MRLPLVLSFCLALLAFACSPALAARCYAPGVLIAWVEGEGYAKIFEGLSGDGNALSQVWANPDGESGFIVLQVTASGGVECLLAGGMAWEAIPLPAPSAPSTEG